jgi:hypothetical protein
MSGLTGYVTNNGTDLSFIFMKRTVMPALVGFSHVVQRFPIIGDTEMKTTLFYQTSLTTNFEVNLIMTNVYGPLGGPYEQPVAPGATRFYRLFAVYSDNMENGNFQIKFIFKAGTPTSQSFTFPITYGGTGNRRISNSDRLTAVNGNHAGSVALFIPGGVTGKKNDGGNLTQISIQFSYLEIQYIDQY